MEEKFDLSEYQFGPFLPYVKDDLITDIDWNGKELWIKDIYLTNKCVTNHGITEKFIDDFAVNVGRLIGIDINPQNVKLEAETDEFRITIVYKSVAMTGTSVNIRRTPPTQRITPYYAIKSNYCDKKVLHLLANFAKAGINIVFCGQPGVGKTECSKFLSTFIPPEEKVITIEDRQEFRYREINPGKRCVALRINENFSFEDALKIVLAMNPDRVMLTEVRSTEVKYLLQCWSSGIPGFTTLHTDDVRNIPDRMLNMMPTRQDAERLVNNVYESLECGVFIDTRYNQETGKTERYIHQVGCFYREKGKNIPLLIARDGKIENEETLFLPDSIRNRLEKKEIKDPLYCEELEKMIQEEEQREEIQNEKVS